MIDENSTFGGFLTTVGEAKQANANALKTPWKLTHLLLGDANGSDPVPDPDQTQLVNQVHRAAINQLSIDPDNPGILIAEVVLPPNIGGWWIRELGIEDEDGDFVAVANCPPSYKPLLAQGSGRNQVVHMHLILSNTANVELKVDPAVVLATREYVDIQRRQHEDDDEAHTDDQIILSVPIAQAPNATKVSEALAALGNFAADGFQNIVVFETPGIITWPVPEVLKQGLRKAFVVVTGGGAGGASGSGSFCTGGGAGATSLGLVDLTGISTIEITIGAGGDEKSSTGPGNNGSSSSFGELISAPGGIGGRLVTGANTGAPAGVGGDINIPGGDGTNATINANTPSAFSPYGGTGGASYWRGGTTGASNAGEAATHGSGGGGNLQGSGRAGGNGIITVRF
ncbi:phage tail protein [Halomonas sp. A40-4]|uniref:phage tail protein n=1 Tax=Halomonas sp. A40-4 TaxID=2785909 RepID=UPI0018EF714B|nr:phage tail protein [Halomonas sp. A40-4]QPL45010.1 phage tail protein [Halomonas sp. A40-4]